MADNQMIALWSAYAYRMMTKGYKIDAVCAALNFNNKNRANFRVEDNTIMYETHMIATAPPPKA